MSGNFVQRVMASGFFILMRFFMRIDGLMIRMNDTRIYHEVCINAVTINKVDTINKPCGVLYLLCSGRIKSFIEGIHMQRSKDF